MRADAAAHGRADVEVVGRGADAGDSPSTVFGHRRDLAGRRLDHRDSRDLAALVLGRDVLQDGVVGRELSGQVEGGADGEPTDAQQVVAVSLRLTERRVGLEHVHDVVAEEGRPRRRAPVERLARLEERLRGGRRVGRCHRGGDVAELGHPTEHLLAPLARGVGVTQGVVGDRLLHGAGERGGLDQGELAGGLGEVATCGGFDAVGTGTEVGDVEIALEDLVLGERALEGERVPHLLELARQRASPGKGRPFWRGGALDKDVLDVLLCQSRATASGGQSATGRVADEGTQQAAGVDTAVVVEAAVLDGHDRLTHHGRDGRQRNLDAVLHVNGGEHRAVSGQDARALRQRRGRELVGERFVVLDGASRGDADATDEGQCRSSGHEPRNHAHREEEPEDAERRAQALLGSRGSRAAGCGSGARRGRRQRHVQDGWHLGLGHSATRVRRAWPLSRFRPVAVTPLCPADSR